MKNYFHSWIGKNYSTGGMFKIPILILGESIYEWEGEKISSDRVVELVRNNATGIESHKFYTNIFSSFTDNERNVENKNEFWESVSHFNYIIQPIQGGPRIPPTDEMIKEAQNEFFNRIQALGTIPTCMVVLGKRLWNYYLPEQGEKGPEIEVNDIKHETWIYKCNNKNIFTTWIYHPSSGFSSEYWFPIIRKFLLMQH